MIILYNSSIWMILQQPYHKLCFYRQLFSLYSIRLPNINFLTFLWFFSLQSYYFIALFVKQYTMEPDPKPKCRYFAQGRCVYGTNCRFSHQGFQQLFLIRHAQSIFNSHSDQLQGQHFHSELAKSTFQLKPQLIDCGLTQNGIKQAENLQLPSECYTLKKKKKQTQTVNIKTVDIVFVSPLNRALQTAKIILKKNEIKSRKIIVLPQLSEVLSKVCDFSLKTEQKKKKYHQFDFEQLEKWQVHSTEQGKFWQDYLLDEFHHTQIQHEHKQGARYMKILADIFPTPLESSQNCFNRTMKALHKIQKISQQHNATKIIVVSHNRILKYICGRNNSGRAQSFENCEIRKVLIQQN